MQLKKDYKWIDSDNEILFLASDLQFNRAPHTFRR